MIAFEVKDMTCNHCVSSITKAVTAVDQGATIQVDLAAHRVEIEPASADVAQIGAAIREAGFTPVALSAGTSGPASAQEKRGGCGGGCQCG